jgi:hypothetical protein
MGFLRRFLGGSRDSSPDDDATPDDESVETLDPDDEERAHALELARFEQGRTDDLIQRQQRYADRSWTPPAQGGERRAEDRDSGDR